MNELNYEPAIFDSGIAKYIWVRHTFAGQYDYSEVLKKDLIEYKFDLKKFYGK